MGNVQTKPIPAPVPVTNNNRKVNTSPPSNVPIHHKDRTSSFDRILNELMMW